MILSTQKIIRDILFTILRLQLHKDSVNWTMKIFSVPCVDTTCTGNNSDSNRSSLGRRSEIESIFCTDKKKKKRKNSNDLAQSKIIGQSPFLISRVQSYMMNDDTYRLLTYSEARFCVHNLNLNEYL